ncbi:aldehyde dehydrogenase family 2 member C4-like [Gossypium australe]|uniref:Aldehyde dehydrogenase family 2 member C4-like n=1 Tax=Gossypium australe TaxID=47621 RepID=A0A5B6WHV7_9ROSI|nr:aldehyde dehydrogenase family 2 member C4-like [Gossypium australe]
MSAFNSTKRRVMGRIEIPLLIGPNTYEVDFFVMDIKSSYNCLLGRYWIHSTGTVPPKQDPSAKNIQNQEDGPVVNGWEMSLTWKRTRKIPSRKSQGTNADGLTRLFWLRVQAKYEAKKEGPGKEARKKKSMTKWGEVKWESMIFLYISKTFVLGEIIYLEREMSEKETVEEMLGNLSINAISEEGTGAENLSGICPYIP